MTRPAFIHHLFIRRPLIDTFRSLRGRTPARFGGRIAAHGVQVERQRVAREVRAVGDVREVAPGVVSADDTDEGVTGEVPYQKGPAGGAADITRAGDLQKVAGAAGSVLVYR